MKQLPTLTSPTWAPGRIALFALLLVASCARGTRGDLATTTSPSPTPNPSPRSTLPGLVSAAPGSEEISLLLLAGDPTTESALFLASSPLAVGTSPPIPLAPAATRHTLRGLTNGTSYHVGLGIREMGAPEYKLTGPILTCRPGPPLYVDSGSDPAGADGLSPQTAFASVTRALLTAFVTGGGNVWIMEGDYETVNIPLFGGVHVYGGFDSAFDLESRDPAKFETRWNSGGAAATVGIQAGTSTAILDGLQLLGLGSGTIGIDIDNADVELRAVSITGFAFRGIRARAAGAVPVSLIMVHSVSSRNGADGLSIRGPFKILLDQCRFDQNAQEGVECGPLEAPDGGEAALIVRGCSMSSNGSEGLDADLAAPTFPGTNGGFFDVRIHESTFDDNVLDGLLIDVDYELVAGYRAAIEVTNSSARANRLSGMHIDADAAVDVFFHRSVASANGRDGFLITSESDPGVVVLSTSVAAANLGAGIRASFGNRTVAASHCVLAGNAAGGIVSETVESSITSSILWLQPTPALRTRVSFSPILDLALPSVFRNAPEAYLTAVSLGVDRLGVSPSTDGIPTGGAIELADDGVARPFSFINAGTLRLENSPEVLALPASLTAFAPGAVVAEDYGLLAGSPAAGAAMAPAGAPPRDAGVFGASAAGLPGGIGETAMDLLRVASISPAPAQPIARAASVSIRFSDELDQASVTLEQVSAAEVDGDPIPLSLQITGEMLLVTPIDGDWGSRPFDLRIHDGIRALDGRPNAASLALPFTTR